VTTARTFYAAINSRHSGISDDDMAVLASFDDVLSQMLAARRASTAEEAALKAEYLTQRVQSGSMSDEAEAAALESMRADFAGVAAARPKARQASEAWDAMWIAAGGQDGTGARGASAAVAS
jgi:hypothetical protein